MRLNISRSSSSVVPRFPLEQRKRFLPQWVFRLAALRFFVDAEVPGFEALQRDARNSRLQTARGEGVLAWLDIHTGCSFVGVEREGFPRKRRTGEGFEAAGIFHGKRKQNAFPFVVGDFQTGDKVSHFSLGSEPPAVEEIGFLWCDILGMCVAFFR